MPPYSCQDGAFASFTKTAQAPLPHDYGKFPLLSLPLPITVDESAEKDKSRISERKWREKVFCMGRMSCLLVLQCSVSARPVNIAGIKKLTIFVVIVIGISADPLRRQRGRRGGHL